MTTGTGREGSGDVLSAVRQRVLDTAMAERQPRRSALAVDPVTPAEALRRTAAELDALLSSLTAADWRRPALRGLDVQALVGHLIGVEEHVHLSLAAAGVADAAIADADHAASTEPAAAAQIGRAPELTRRDLRDAIAVTLDLVADLPDPQTRQIAIHGLRLPVAAFLVVRSFELWTHDNDIRRASGRGLSRPDDATLQLMTELAAEMVPVAVRRTSGSDLDRTIRLVLTGPGGGVWDLGGSTAPGSAVGGSGVGGSGRGAPAARIVVDAVEFCRLVANRMAPADLALDVWGDRQLVDTVLSGAGSLALD